MRSEHQEQCEFVEWMNKRFPEHRVSASPNGGKRHIRTAITLKAEGVSKGFPDLSIPSLFLYIEMKKEKGGQVSKEQKAWLEYLNDVGYTAVVAKGAEAAKRVVLDLVEQRRVS